MIRTPSLRTRLVIVTLTLVIGVVVAMDSVVYLVLDAELDDTLEEVLAARIQTVTQADSVTNTPDELLAALDDAGVPATVTTTDGRELVTEPGTRLFNRLPPDADVGDDPANLRGRVELADGSTATVLVSRGGVQSTLRQIRLVELLVSLGVLTVAVVLVSRLARLVTRPVDQIVELSDEIADGATHLRIHPSDPTTEIGRMAAAMDTVVEALDTALQSARDAEQRSRSFLADAAHQLRTPVAGLRASAETLAADPTDRQRGELLGTVVAQAHRTGKLVNALLSMARIDRTEPMANEPVSLADLVDEEVAHQRMLSPNLTFDVRIPDDAEPVVRGDHLWLREAVGNLLDNARRHAFGVVVVSLTPALGSWHVTVRDDGPGVPTEHRDRIFDRFVSLDGQGSGLGLPIARGIAEAHQGSLTLSGDGFVMRLPVSPAAPVEVSSTG